MTAKRSIRGVFGRIHLLDHDQPGLTTETWAERQPVRRLTLAGRRVVLTQPSSTLWVYALGLLACLLGARWWWLADGETVLQLWAVGLWLWGVGALLAGTSYQAFGYHLKCRDGRVRWTNWWEATYMVCQQLSIDALLVATAVLATDGPVRTVLVLVAVSTAVGFTASTLVGAVLPNRFLLSFEWMSLVSAPAVVAMLGIHVAAVARGGDPLDRALVGVWAGLLACMTAYGLYRRSGIGDRLWARGRWFSENDVLHVTLIVWLLGIGATGDLFVDRLAG